MSNVQRCTVCDGPTTYRVLTGGREWDCLDFRDCGMSGEYEEGRAPRRAAMLQSAEGREALRTEMREELAARKTEK